VSESSDEDATESDSSDSSDTGITENMPESRPGSRSSSLKRVKFLLYAKKNTVLPASSTAVIHATYARKKIGQPTGVTMEAVSAVPVNLKKLHDCEYTAEV